MYRYVYVSLLTSSINCANGTVHGGDFKNATTQSNNQSQSSYTNYVHTDRQNEWTYKN